MEVGSPVMGVVYRLMGFGNTHTSLFREVRSSRERMNGEPNVNIYFVPQLMMLALFMNQQIGKID